MESLVTINTLFNICNYVLLFNGLGYITSVLQKMIIIQIKDNIDISLWRILLELSIFFSSVYTFSAAISRPQNTLVTDQCQNVMEIDEATKEKAAFIYALISQTGLAISMQM